MENVTYCSPCEPCEHTTAVSYGSHCVDCGGPRWTGRYSRKALRAACAELGVKRLVRVVRVEGGPDGRLGYHKVHGEGHELGIDARCTVRTANESILHELTHAAQLERAFEAGPDKLREYTSANLVGGGPDDAAYLSDPFEQEARRTAAALCIDYRIARRAT